MPEFQSQFGHGFLSCRGTRICFFSWDFAKPEWYPFGTRFVQWIFRGARRTKALCQPVLSLLNHLLRDLLPQFDSVEGAMFSEPSQDRQLCAKHIAVGDCGNDFSRR